MPMKNPGMYLDKPPVTAYASTKGAGNFGERDDHR
jgi:hypothetical protein